VLVFALLYFHDLTEKVPENWMHHFEIMLKSSFMNLRIINKLQRLLWLLLSKNVEKAAGLQ
jgi:hypothetical protein